MRTLSQYGWHKIAAIAFLVRFVVTLPLYANSASAIIPGLALHILLAIGYWRRSTVAIWFGLYAAVFSGISPFVMGSIAWPQPWLWINAAISVPVFVVALLAWRESRQPRAV